MPPCGPCGPGAPPPGAGYICWYICAGGPPGGAFATTKPLCIICGAPPPGPMALMGGAWSGAGGPCCQAPAGTGPPAPGTAPTSAGRAGFGWPSTSWYEEPFASGQSGAPLSGAELLARWKKGSRICPSSFRRRSGFFLEIENCKGAPAGFTAACIGWPPPPPPPPLPPPLGVNSPAWGLRENALAWGLKENCFGLAWSPGPCG
mmetsp:Transcript_45068/g.143575  ORF Transcript_45068/g.143575 Transcript_45068/m.143575 type:complete len:204 (-) Transcript_45068:1365-1976(-)